jgi:hypothetical protein
MYVYDVHAGGAHRTRDLTPVSGVRGGSRSRREGAGRARRAAQGSGHARTVAGDHDRPVPSGHECLIEHRQDLLGAANGIRTDRA